MLERKRWQENTKVSKGHRHYQETSWKYQGKNVQRKNTKFARPSLPRIAKRYASANHAQYAFLDLLPEPSRIGNDYDSHHFTLLFYL